MTSLYKYRSNFKRDLKSLINEEIYIPSINQLNDSFEGWVDNRNIKKLLGYLIEKGFKDEKDFPLEQINANLGVFSMSKTFLNNVLWSHYAGNHKGFIIEYNLEYILKTFAQNKIVHSHFEIKYKKNPPRDSAFNTIEANNSLGIKSKEWSYEEEYRIVVENFGNHKIKKECISSIIFGANCSTRNISYSKNLLKKNGFKIPLYQLKKIEGHFVMKKELI